MLTKSYDTLLSHQGHQASTWTKADLSSVRSSDINLMAISEEIPQPSITKICSKITDLKFHLKLPGPMS